MWWQGHPGMGWWMLFGGLWMLLVWGALFALVVWGIRTLVAPRRRDSEAEEPLLIAQRRFARGEITREDLEQIRQALRR